MVKFGPEPEQEIAAYIDSIPDLMNELGDQHGSTALLDNEQRFNLMKQRYKQLPSLLVWAQGGNFLDLLIETRNSFIRGHYWATVSLCGVTIESMCRDIVKNRSEEQEFTKKILQQDVRKNIEDLAENGYFWLTATKGLMHNVLDVRNDYVHVKKENINIDEIFDCLLRTHLSVIAEFGLMPSENGRVVRVNKDYFDKIASSINIDLTKFW